jgi:hypothetical protein
MVSPVIIADANPFEPGGIDNTITYFPYLRTMDYQVLNIDQATDDLELIILPH